MHELSDKMQLPHGKADLNVLKLAGKTIFQLPVWLEKCMFKPVVWLRKEVYRLIWLGKYT